MIVLTGIAVSLAWFVLLVPWRVPARPLGPVAQRGPRVGEARAGGPLWGATLVAVVMGLHPLAGIPVAAWPSLRFRQVARRVERSDQHAALRSLPVAADLVALGVASGLSVPAAIRRTVVWMDEPYRSVFSEALRRADAGDSFVSAILVASEDLDAAATPLIALITAAQADGGSLLAGLTRISDEARRKRRDAASIRARRLPVTMLLPLVLCVLPAFGLLAVAPMVLTALGGLDLGF